MQIEPLITGVTLYTSQIERLYDFYSSLGLTMKKEKHNGIQHYSNKNNGIIFEIYPSVNHVKDITSIGFEVRGLDKIVEKIKKESIHSPLKKEKGRISASIRDPDGRLVFLTEILKKA